MFDVGFWELILIFGVGLMILGPERMPRVAAQIGRWVGRARRTATQLRRQLQRELELDEHLGRRPPPPKPPAAPRKPEPKDEASAPAGSTDAVPVTPAGPPAGSPPAGETGAGVEGDDAVPAKENRILSPDQASEPRDAEAAEEPAKSP